MRLHEIRTIDRPLTEVFAFTADFANAENWDPGVESSRRVGQGPPEVGAEYELVVAFGSSRLPMRYIITELETDERVVLEGESERVNAIDEIIFEAIDGRTLVDYSAELTFQGWMRFLDPLMAPLMKRMVAKKALDGLVAALET